METERNSIDDTIIDLTYYNLKGAQYLMEIISGTARTLAKGDINAETKKALKRDMQFTSSMVNTLNQAVDGYKKFDRCTSLVEQQLDSHAKLTNYDWAQGVLYDLMAVNLVYLMITDHGFDRKNRKKIHDYLKKFKWDEGLKDLYDHLELRHDNFQARYEVL